MDIKELFVQTIEKYHMIEKGETVMVGVSGGPDSVCLLHLLLGLKNQLKIGLCVAHLDHMFRGKESEEDARFVEQLCQNWDIPFYHKKINVPQYVKKTGLSEEDAARRVRYSFFEKAKRDLKATKVALGHNRNDHEETVLMNILRGTGLEGLLGIEPVRGFYIRPLIEISRHHIETYLKDKGINFRTDKSNLSTKYFRNKLRLELIPLIEEKYCGHFSRSLGRLSEIVRQDLAYFEKQTRQAMESAVQLNPKKVGINTVKFLELDEAIKRRVLRKCVEYITGDVKDFELKNVKLLLEFIEQSSAGSQMDLPKGLRAQKSYDYVYLVRGKSDDKRDFEYPLPVPGKLVEESLGITLETFLEPNTETNILTNNSLIAQLDYDKIIGNLTIRNRRPGDRFFPFGLNFSKKLQDFLTDLKVPRQERDKIPIVVDGAGRIVWLAGIRLDNRFKITDSTRMVLTIKMSMNSEQGD